MITIKDANTLVRKQEVEELKRLYKSNKAELIVVYGGRRVGKTYLIDETFFKYAFICESKR